MTSKSTTQPHITVYRGWKDSVKYIWSPFVTKLEFRLRHGGLSYQTDAGSMSKAPKGKLPYITITEIDSKSGDTGNSTSLADSTLIIQALMENGLLEDVNAPLSPADRAHDLALRALLEDKLYFYHVRIFSHTSQQINCTSSSTHRRLTDSLDTDLGKMAPKLLYHAWARSGSIALPIANSCRPAHLPESHGDPAWSRYWAFLTGGDCGIPPRDLGKR